jgi:hypothetical protein
VSRVDCTFARMDTLKLEIPTIWKRCFFHSVKFTIVDVRFVAVGALLKHLMKNRWRKSKKEWQKLVFIGIDSFDKYVHTYIYLDL